MKGMILKSSLVLERTQTDKRTHVKHSLFSGGNNLEGGLLFLS